MWQAVLGGIGGLSSFLGARAQNKAARAQQAWMNAMTRLSDSINQNAITTNELLSNRAFAQQALDIQANTSASIGAAAVNAAAYGVSGNSVDDLIFNMRRSSATAEFNRQEELKASWMAFDQQRLQSAFGAEINQDRTFLPKPSLVGHLISGLSSTGSFNNGAFFGKNGYLYDKIFGGSRG